MTSAQFLNYSVSQKYTKLMQDVYVRMFMCFFLNTRVFVCALVFAYVQVNTNTCKCHKAACA